MGSFTVSSSFIKDSGRIVIGALLLAIGVSLFLSPNRIAVGSTTGLAIVLHYVTEIQVGKLLVLVNMPLIVLGLYTLGRRFTLKTICFVIVASLFTHLLGGLLGLPRLTNNMALASLYGGAFVGLGVGLVFKSGGSAGGAGIIASIISRQSFLRPGQILFIVDMFVIALSGLVFDDVDQALWGGISVFVSARAVDMVLTGTPFAKTVLITTRCMDEIAPLIQSELELPVTIMAANELSPDSEKHVISVLANAKQIQEINRIVSDCDPQAIIVVSEASEIIGRV